VGEKGYILQETLPPPKKKKIIAIKIKRSGNNRKNVRTHISGESYSVASV